MRFGRCRDSLRFLFWRPLFLLVLVTGASPPAPAVDDTTTRTTVWDTMSPLDDAVDLQSRTGWRLVPTDLLTLERDPQAAASDPGYYGREYAFQGDAVVENDRIAAVLHSRKGRLVVCPKQDTNGTRLELVPLALQGKPARITRCSILQNTGQDAALEVTFSDEGVRLSAVVVFDRTEIVEIQPGTGARGLSLGAPLAYGIVPSFIGDDLVFRPADSPSAKTLCLPSENLFVGLLAGHESMLVVTWPEGAQRARLVLGEGEGGARTIESLDLESDGKSVCLAVLSAPGIWHREELKPSYLEKDVTIDWRRPFPAKWITQLSEGRVPTTYAFREAESRIWRGVVGHYTYPVWFSGDRATYRLSKKIPPKGESIVYFLERRDTPDAVLAPVDVLKATLGRTMAAAILDVPGRKLRTHHRRGADGVRRACTCGCTEAIQAVFDAGEEARRKEYVDAAVDDMVFFVTQHMERIGEYLDFSRDLTDLLDRTRGSAGELKEYIERMRETAQEIPEEHQGKLELIRSLEYAGELARETKALARGTDAGNKKAYEELSLKWRRMGGAQDDLVAQCHRIARKLFQEAGYGGTGSPEAAELAREIRARCARCLRRADGYEIWADY